MTIIGPFSSKQTIIAYDDDDGNAQAQDDDDVVVLLLLHFVGCVAVVPLLLPIS